MYLSIRGRDARQDLLGQPGEPERGGSAGEGTWGIGRGSVPRSWHVFKPDVLPWSVPGSEAPLLLL